MNYNKHETRIKYNIDIPELGHDGYNDLYHVEQLKPKKINILMLTDRLKNFERIIWGERGVPTLANKQFRNLVSRGDNG